jgi:pSer/pThr/pTyr-binding forkhead associated (FHA) protein
MDEARPTLRTGREYGSQEQPGPMPVTVTLTVTAAGMPERTYVFDQPADFVAGRALDCDIRIDMGQSTVSRHHCVFEIDPPQVLIRDLNSSNGTYVNGGALEPSGEWYLRHGDVVRLGRTVVQVTIAE